MTEQQVKPSTVADPRLRAIYEEAFPEQERIEWPELLRLVAVMPLHFTAYRDGDALVGFTIVYPNKNYNWFWYFAVAKELRGKGYGSQILSRVVARYGSHRLILDMESPSQPCDNAAQRRRRLDFYVRHGFSDTRARRTFGGVEYTIMMYGKGSFTSSDYDDIINGLRRFWTPDEKEPTEK